MKNICILGVGKIGIRHLESILKIKRKFNIYLFEKNINYKKLNRFININNNKSFHKINIHNQVYNTGIYFDILIISTNSDVRFDVFFEFVKLNKVRNIIFEKIVFQDNNLYKKAISITRKYKINTYVNLPRRIYPVYNFIKKKLLKNLPIKFSFNSSNWNLASNSIHFIDLFCYLENSYIVKVKSDLENSIISSKRKNFLEFKGNLNFESNIKGKLSISDKNDNNDKISYISIKQKNILFYVFELENKCIFIKKNKIMSIKYFDVNTPFQSDLTKIIVMNILNNKKVVLPNLTMLKKNHEIIINIFKDHLKNIKYSKKNNFIT